MYKIISVRFPIGVSKNEYNVENMISFIENHQSYKGKTWAPADERFITFLIRPEFSVTVGFLEQIKEVAGAKDFKFSVKDDETNLYLD